MTIHVVLIGTRYIDYLYIHDLWIHFTDHWHTQASVLSQLASTSRTLATDFNAWIMKDFSKEGRTLEFYLEHKIIRIKKQESCQLSISIITCMI
jgi:hypothetical protein